MSTQYDIEFFWDPVCPFAWITSRWVVKVAAQTGYQVDWRFIDLRLMNKQKDYATEFPPDYEHGHTAGLRMLWVTAKVRSALGRGQQSRGTTRATCLAVRSAAEAVSTLTTTSDK
jgi:predicted DsbA family dithiol-disulfide isomerase